MRGNADDWLLGEMPAEADEDGRRLRAIVEWARGQLRDADVAYLESFLPTIELDLAIQGPTAKTMRAGDDGWLLAA